MRSDLIKGDEDCHSALACRNEPGFHIPAQAVVADNKKLKYYRFVGRIKRLPDGGERLHPINEQIRLIPARDGETNQPLVQTYGVAQRIAGRILKWPKPILRFREQAIQFRRFPMTCLFVAHETGLPKNQE